MDTYGKLHTIHLRGLALLRNESIALPRAEHSLGIERPRSEDRRDGRKPLGRTSIYSTSKFGGEYSINMEKLPP